MLKRLFIESQRSSPTNHRKRPFYLIQPLIKLRPNPANLCRGITSGKGAPWGRRAAPERINPLAWGFYLPSSYLSLYATTLRLKGTCLSFPDDLGLYFQLWA